MPLCSGSTESEVLDCQGSPCLHFRYHFCLLAKEVIKMIIFFFFLWPVSKCSCKIMTCFLPVKIALPGHRENFESSRSFETRCLFLSEPYLFSIILQNILTTGQSRQMKDPCMNYYRTLGVIEWAWCQGNFIVRAGRLPTSHCVNKTNHCIVVVGTVSKTLLSYVVFLLLLNILKAFFLSLYLFFFIKSHTFESRPKPRKRQNKYSGWDTWAPLLLRQPFHGQRKEENVTYQQMIESYLPLIKTC